MTRPHRRVAAVCGVVALALFRTSALADAPPSPLAAGLALVKGATLLAFDEPLRPGAPRVRGAAATGAALGRTRATLADPWAYQRAVPELRRIRVLKEVPAGAGPPDRLLAWELEIPLWNLSGTLWMRVRGETVSLELVDGDFAPGSFTLAARTAGAGTAVTLEARANVRDANWLTKRLAARSPLTEPAMLATACTVLLRALALEAEGVPATHPRRRPTTAITPPRAETFAASALAPLAVAGVVAAVHTRPDGRLGHVEIAVPTTLPPDRLPAMLREPHRWRALPGWRSIRPRSTGGALIWDVDTTFPFVDFDAAWQVGAGPFRATAIDGPTKGASMGWDVARVSDVTVATLSMHPRIDRAGYLPRKFVEAEPLLEHGLAVGLAYVDALTLLRGIADDARRAGQRRQ